MRRLFAGLVLTAGLAGPALAEDAFFKSGPTVSLSVSSASADAALVAAPAATSSVWTCNTGTTLAYVGFGDSTYAATTSDIPLPGGVCATLNPNGKTYIAAVTTTSTTTILATPGQGALQGSGGGGSGGGGGGGNSTIVGPLGSASTDAQSVAVTDGGTLPTGVSLPAGATGLQGVLGAIMNYASSSLAAGTNIVGKVGIDQTTPGTTNGVVHVAAAAGGALNYLHYSVATSSGDTQFVKASAGTVYSITVTQSTTTAMELKLYNSTSAPTCSSATGIVDNIPIPSNVTSPGYHLTFPVGRAFSTGIAYCIVAFGAPAASTDSGTPATGVTLSMTYD